MAETSEVDLVAELARAAAGDGETARYGELVTEVVTRAQGHSLRNQGWRAVALLAGGRDAIAPRTDLDRPLALAHGQQAELVLRWADALRVRPTAELLDGLDAELHRGLEADPTLPDLHWDLAVIAARYRGDYDAAAEHLARALELGYEHPMAPRLAAIIDARPPPPPPEPDVVGVQVARLLLELADQACGPMESRLHIDDGEVDVPGPGGRTFGDYVAAARDLVADRSWSVDEQLELLGRSSAIGGDAGEYVVDLLRRIGEMRAASDAPDGRFVEAATSAHLDILRRTSFAHFDEGRTAGNELPLRRAKRASERALGIVAMSSAAVDPDLHADLLLARGQALYALDQRNVIETTRCYREALQLKRAAGNVGDVERLTQLLWNQIDHRAGEMLATLHFGGMGETLDVATVCVDAADELDDRERALALRADLAVAQRSVGLRAEAEQNLRRVIAGSSTPELVSNAKFELASVLSETGRASEAAELQRELIAAAGPDADSTLLSNYSQSLVLLGCLDEARDLLDRAWRGLPSEERQRDGQRVPLQGAWIRTLQADVASQLGDQQAALAHLAAAEALNDLPLGIAGLHFHRIKARVLLAGGRPDDALDSLDAADNLLRSMLSMRPSYATWESMLREWSPLDALAVRGLIQRGDPVSVERALVRAESTKGRVTAWLETKAAPEGAERSLDVERQRSALERTRAWLDLEPDSYVVSLFAAREGLAVFLLGPGEVVDAAWLDDFDYDAELRDHFEPWERAVEASAAGDERAVAHASAATEALLDRVGPWLTAANPDLGRGGRRLVIVPHRFFRSLPLLHVRLPGGRRIAEVFDEVVVVPTLAHLVEPHRRVDRSEPGSAARAAIADSTPDEPDGGLPFARCEAILAAPPERRWLGAAATADTVRRALLGPGTLLLSVHGDFDEQNPLRSILVTSDGALQLADLVLDSRVGASQVLLGACESGRSRRSVSDEPQSFPTLLVQGGAHMVVAPAWPVDDFSSFLVTTRLVELIDSGEALPAAVASTAGWLRALTAAEARERLAQLVAQLDADEEGLTPAVPAAIAEQRDWLASLPPGKRPFSSALDWAAHQTVVAGYAAAPAVP